MNLYSSLLIGTLAVGGIAATGIAATGVGIWAGSGTSSKVEDSEKTSDEEINSYFNQDQSADKKECESRKNIWIGGIDGTGTCTSTQQTIPPNVGFPPPPSPQELEEEKSKDNE